ncbi:hypothetical protein ACHAWX_006354 [Stephanocyclus meneghinianus]
MITVMIRLIPKRLARLTAVGPFTPLAQPIKLLATNRGTCRNSVVNECMLPICKRYYQKSAVEFKYDDNVFVAIEKSRNGSATTHAQDTSLVSNKSCGTPTDKNDEEEMEQEDMFVTADPILGHGAILEWGGPRRGGSLMEPTRFGDWERKGRCTDF